MCARLLLALALLVPAAGGAASSVQPLTPANTSVAGGERQVYAARFFDAFGQPSVGERVTFANDACGFFENGAFSIVAITDSTGVASATFTARPQGITCWVTASAGATARFNVFTYTAAQVAIVATLVPAQPRVGQPFAVAAGAYAGAYPIYNADIGARIVPGSASASLAPASGNSAQAGRVDFTVTPDGRIGDYEIEVAFRGIARRIPVKAPAAPLQDMWWAGPAGNGWGMSIVQHGERLFSVIYAYDADGHPTWYVMSDGTWNAQHTSFSGALYRPRGAPWSAYDAARFVPGEPVGNASITFVDASHATLAYSIAGVSGSRALTRQLFGPADSRALPELGDMWWGGIEQNGWGIAILQQYATLFGVWFTYDASGAPTWFVMPSGFWSDATTYEGRLYRTTGSPWLGAEYDAAALRHVDVGRYRLRFAAEGASFEYTIDGSSATLALTRQPF